MCACCCSLLSVDPLMLSGCPSSRDAARISGDQPFFHSHAGIRRTKADVSKAISQTYARNLIWLSYLHSLSLVTGKSTRMALSPSIARGCAEGERVLLHFGRRRLTPGRKDDNDSDSHQPFRFTPRNHSCQAVALSHLPFAVAKMVAGCNLNYWSIGHTIASEQE